MMVGDILGAARRSAISLPDWIERRAPELARRCAEVAGKNGISNWLQSTVGWFELHATGDDWADLTSKMRDSEAPGEIFLITMVEKRLAVVQLSSQGEA